MATLSYEQSGDPIKAPVRQAENAIAGLDLNDGQVHTIYKDGILAYQGNRYERAKAFFSLCCMLRPTRDDYLFALALALKMSGEYVQALPVFLAAGMHAQFSFKPMLHAVECLLHLQRKSEAIELLRSLLDETSEDVDASLLQRAQTWLEFAEHGESNAGNAN